jgi:hypothetical protein
MDRVILIASDKSFWNQQDRGFHPNVHRAFLNYPEPQENFDMLQKW